MTGGVTTKVRRDSTTTRAPGQEWLYTTRAGLELRRTVRVNAFGSVVGAVPRRGPSGGEHAAKISGYRETNSCAPTAPVKLEKPACDSSPIAPMLAGITSGTRGRVFLALSRQRAGARAGAVHAAHGDLAGPVLRITTLGQPGADLRLGASAGQAGAATR